MAGSTPSLFTDDKQLGTIVASRLVALGVEAGLADHASSWIVSDDAPRAVVGELQVSVVPFPSSSGAVSGSGWNRNDLQSVRVADDIGVIEDIVLHPVYQPILKVA